MDELTAIRQLLASPPPPAPDVVAAAQARLERAARGSGARGWRAQGRRGRLAVAAGLAAAVAAGAGLIAMQVIHAGGATPAGALTVHELAYRAAAAAERQPQVRPSQWVYWKEATASVPASSFQVWTTADSTKAAFVARGNLHFIDVPRQGAMQILGQPNASGGVVIAKIPITYSGLGSLPSRPHALLRYLGNLALPYPGGYGSAPAQDFAIIEELVTTYVMPPGLTAELYRALGDIPGVTVNSHAEDVAGRQGIGFISPSQPGGGSIELIFDSRTYRLTGDDFLASASHRPLTGTAILREALVSGPGARPQNG
jgi:hypothetical protein